MIFDTPRGSVCEIRVPIPGPADVVLSLNLLDLTGFTNWGVAGADVLDMCSRAFAELAQAIRKDPP